MGVAAWSGSLLGWEKELSALKARLTPLFRRKELKATAGGFVDGLLSGVERKTCWADVVFAPVSSILVFAPVSSMKTRFSGSNRAGLPAIHRGPRRYPRGLVRLRAMTFF
jgi:hypothetical protein